MDDEPLHWPEPEASGLEPMQGIEVHMEDNPVVAQLYHPDGSILLELRQRNTVPIGFAQRKQV